MGEHVVGDRARERVLGVGVEVDLHDAVGDRRPHVLRRRAAGAVEDVLEARARVGARERVLAVAQDLGAQLHVARRVQRRGRCRTSPRAGSGRARRCRARRRPAAGPPASCRAARRPRPSPPIAVLLAADDAALDLEHDVRARGTAPAASRGEAQVLLQRQRRAVEHVRVEQRRARRARPGRRSAAISGRRKASTWSGGQWSVCRPIGDREARRRARGRTRRAPARRSPRPPPRRRGSGAPPTVICDDPVRRRPRRTRAAPR